MLLFAQKFKIPTHYEMSLNLSPANDEFLEQEVPSDATTDDFSTTFLRLSCNIRLFPGIFSSSKPLFPSQVFVWCLSTLTSAVWMKVVVMFSCPQLVVRCRDEI